MSSDRLTRKEIKEDIRHDEVQHFLGDLIMRIEERPTFYLGLLGVVLALIAGASGIYAMMNSRNEAGNEELGKAIKIYGAPIEAQNAKPDDADKPSFSSESARKAKAKDAFDKVEGGEAGQIAELYQAGMALAEGDKAKARKIWEKFVADHKGDALAMTVRLNLIQLDREEGKGQQVLDQLQKELDGKDKSLPDDVLIYELARTREALGQKDEAKKLYQRLLDEYPTSAYTGDARRVTTG
jgi:tetratricopeptide (TPR) repeat protein